MTTTDPMFSEQQYQERVQMYNDYVKQIQQSRNVSERNAKRIMKSITNKQIKKFQKNVFKNRNKEKIYIDSNEALNEI